MAIARAGPSSALLLSIRPPDGNGIQTAASTYVISTKIGPNSFMRSMRSYKLTHPSSVFGGKNSKLTHGGEPG